MSAINLSASQEQQLGKMIADLGEDAALRERFQANVRSVFNDYGLGELLPADMQFEARLSEAEVSGFDLPGPFGHWDLSHTDTHLDMVIPVVGGFQVVPRAGRIA